jgi:signal peptidase I
MAQRSTSRRTSPGTPQPVAPSGFRFFRRRAAAGAPSPKSSLRQHVESLLFAVLVALLVRSSVVEAFWVPSGSMLPTIQIGDHLFVNKLAYGLHVDLPFGLANWDLAEWRPVQRGDIVVFTRPDDHRTDLIKRVIAVAGDTLEVRNKHLFINGQEVPDPHARFTDPQVRSSVPRDNFGPVTVPPGKFFVMGDNRDQSYDSRYWGFADQRDVKGKATFIYWSGWKWDRMGHYLR